MILKKHKKTIGVVLAILIAFGTFAYQFNKIHTLSNLIEVVMVKTLEY